MNRPLLGVVALLWVVGCVAAGSLLWPLASGYLARHTPPGDRPIPHDSTYDRQALKVELAAQNLSLGDEAHVRIFKREKLLELWLRPAGGRYVLFKSYPICAYSGTLGPKLAEGDRQAPEGFYRVGAKQLNPHSRHHLAFNLGFPNALDRALDRTGSFLMVHGGCTSIGCYAMTDPQVDEIYAMVEAALQRGQKEVDVAAFPFRMTETALQQHAGSAWLPFWRNLKQEADLFAALGEPPRVAACNGQYVFGDGALGADCTPISGWV